MAEGQTGWEGRAGGSQEGREAGQGVREGGSRAGGGGATGAQVDASPGRRMLESRQGGRGRRTPEILLGDLSVFSVSDEAVSEGLLQLDVHLIFHLIF